jgi:molybdopterin converting factor subunit 1
MKIRFFAQLRQFTGVDAAEIEISQPVGAGALWSLLDAEFPGIRALESSTRLARNHEYAPAGALFSDDDEVALIPPVSGG